MTSLIVGVAMFSFVFAFVGGFVSDLYWKKHPNGYVYTITGKRRRRPRYFWI